MAGSNTVTIPSTSAGFSCPLPRGAEERRPGAEAMSPSSGESLKGDRRGDHIQVQNVTQVGAPSDMDTPSHAILAGPTGWAHVYSQALLPVPSCYPGAV